MDPFSVSISVLTVLQATTQVLSLCCKLRAGLQKVPKELVQIMEETQHLRNIVQAVHSIAEKSESNLVRGGAEADSVDTLGDAIHGPLAACKEEMVCLERMLEPMLAVDLQTSKLKTTKNAIRWILKESQVVESLARLERYKSSLGMALTTQNLLSAKSMEAVTLALQRNIESTHSQIATVASILSQAKLSDEKQEVMGWISQSNPWDDHDAILRTRQLGTGQWLTESPEYQNWRNGQHRILWLSGLPGAGKTYLFANCVDGLLGSLDSDHPVALCAFSYCDFRSPASHDITDILGSLLNQLSIQAGGCPNEAVVAYNSRAARGFTTPPTREMLLRCLIAMAQFHKLILCIDALDEHPAPQQLVETMTYLAQATTNTSLFVTSRNNADIQDLLNIDTIRVRLEEKVDQMVHDTHLYIAGRLKSESKLSWLTAQTRYHISTSLDSKALGMVRWAQCQLDGISRARTVRDIKRALERLPEGLNGTYERILSQVASEDFILFHKITTWLAFSVCPLSVRELWEAMAIESGSSCIDDEYRLRSPDDILAIGNSLVGISEDGHVRLVHLSVRDYLLSDTLRQHPKFSKFALDPAEGHRQLANDCLTYLSFDQLREGPSESPDSYLGRLESLPLLKYAATAWTYHIRSARFDNQLQAMANSFFSTSGAPQFEAWVQVINADANFKWSVYPRHPSQLYYAASFGLENVVLYLLSQDLSFDINGPGSRFGGTALHGATIRHHISVMRQLLGAGAEPQRADFNGVTPLHSAATRGDMEAARLLLEHGARKDARDGMHGEVPADWARMSGHVNMVNMLSETKEGVKGSVDLGNTAPPAYSSIRSDQPVVWQSAGEYYFPDFYEKRSGLTSSILVSVDSGDV